MEVSEGTGDMCRTKLRGFERQANVQTTHYGKMTTQTRETADITCLLPCTLIHRSVGSYIVHFVLHSCVHSRWATAGGCRDFLEVPEHSDSPLPPPIMEDLSLAAQLEPGGALCSWAGLQLKVRLAQPHLQENDV